MVVAHGSLVGKEKRMAVARYKGRTQIIRDVGYVRHGELYDVPEGLPDFDYTARRLTEPAPRTHAHTAASLGKLSKDELTALASKAGVSTGGTKAELVERLVEHHGLR